MTVLHVAAAIFGVGCFGGFVNSLIAGELHLPKLDLGAGVWRPGWLGNVVIGGTAALVFWGLYGPMAAIQIVGDQAPAKATLHVAELFGAILTGIGGGRLLTAEVDRRVLRTEKAALEETKVYLSEIVAQTAKRSAERDNE